MVLGEIKKMYVIYLHKCKEAILSLVLHFFVFILDLLFICGMVCEISLIFLSQLTTNKYL